MSHEWDLTADVVVVGSGAAGLAAAITAHDGGRKVEIIEATEMIGGTSAISGGQPWVPCNHHMREAGLTDSRADALRYLDRLTQGREPDRRRLATFVDRGAEALAYLESATPLKTTICTTFSDYHADLPGGVMQGRSLDIVPFPAREKLGDLDERIRRGTHLPTLTLDEMAGVDTGGDPKSLTVAAGTGDLAADLTVRMAERDAAGVRTCGGALVAALLKGVVDRGMSVRTSARADRLVVENGKVVGLVVVEDGRETWVAAEAGVVLAAGGFEWNAEMVKTFLGVPEIWPVSPPSNRGEALQMGLEVGASLANMSVAWACPVLSDGRAMLDGAPLHIMSTPRQEPGVIVVNRQGRRFSNEAIAYMYFGLSHRDFDPIAVSWPNEAPVWLIFDRAVRERTAVGDFVPDGPTPDWAHEAATVEELAAEIGIEADVLVETVDRWNESVEGGADEEFGRGTAWFEGWTSGGPGPHMLAKLEQGPFYALPLYDGVLGTAGGLRTDERGRVVAARGGVVDGLYAAGNAAASVFGPAYPGGGATLGQALTFAFLAGRDLSESQVEGRQSSLTART